MPCGRRSAHPPSVLGDQIYLAGLLEAAGKTPVGKTWLLDRDQVMIDLAVTPWAFQELQVQIELRMPGKWNRASATDGSLFVYMRTG